MSAPAEASAVALDRHGPVAVLTLNRPECANAINDDMRRELFQLGAELATDETVSVVVVTGAGQHFCAGADLRESHAERVVSRQRYVRATDLAARLPQPVIAAIQGAAVGGGLELALKCDVRIAHADARLGLPEIQFGALPTGGGMVRLPRLIGPAAAKLMVLSGESLDGREAHRLGLVELVCEEPVRAVALDLAQKLAQRPRYALVAAKLVIDGSASQSIADGDALQREVTATMATREERVQQARRAARSTEVYGRIFRQARS